MKHSLSPFTIEERMHVWAIKDARGNDVAYQDIAPQFYQGEPCGSVLSRCRTAEELKANARLFAAAPELLSLLEHITGLYALKLQQAGFDDKAIAAGVVGRAREAIAKAM